MNEFQQETLSVLWLIAGLTADGAGYEGFAILLYGFAAVYLFILAVHILNRIRQ